MWGKEILLEGSGSQTMHPESPGRFLKTDSYCQAFWFSRSGLGQNSISNKLSQVMLVLLVQGPQHFDYTMGRDSLWGSSQCGKGRRKLLREKMRSPQEKSKEEICLSLERKIWREEGSMKIEPKKNVLRERALRAGTSKGKGISWGSFNKGDTEAPDRGSL